MIDDTLFHILPNVEFQKLIAFEEKQFKSLLSNLKTKESKLDKQEHEVPSAEERHKVAKTKGMDKFRAATNTI